MSRMILHFPSASPRQTELKVPTRFQPGSRTGPVLRARVPGSRTSTRSGSQEKGASGCSERAFQAWATAGWPRRAAWADRKIASAAGKDAKALFIAIGHGLREGSRRLPDLARQFGPRPRGRLDGDDAGQVGTAGQQPSHFVTPPGRKASKQR